MSYTEVVLDRLSPGPAGYKAPSLAADFVSSRDREKEITRANNAIFFLLLQNSLQNNGFVYQDNEESNPHLIIDQMRAYVAENPEYANEVLATRADGSVVTVGDAINYFDRRFSGDGSIRLSDVLTNEELAVAAIRLPQDVLNRVRIGSNSEFASPILGQALDELTINSSFRERRHPITGRRTLHQGVDIDAEVGDGVQTIADGVIIDIGYQQNGRTGWGQYVRVMHFGPDGTPFITQYNHLDNSDRNNQTITLTSQDGTQQIIREGMYVSAGQIIGQVGRTGGVTGAHLDMNVMVLGSNGNPSLVNPITFMSAGMNGIATGDQRDNLIAQAREDVGRRQAARLDDLGERWFGIAEIHQASSVYQEATTALRTAASLRDIDGTRLTGNWRRNLRDELDWAFGVGEEEFVNTVARRAGQDGILTREEAELALNDRRILNHDRADALRALGFNIT